MMDTLDGQQANTLEATPLPSWLWQAFEQCLTGTLVIQESTGEKHAVYVEEGMPRAAHTTPPFGAFQGHSHADLLARQVTWLADRPVSSRFYFFEAADYLAQTGSESRPSLNPRALLWRVIREQTRSDDVEATWAELEQKQFVLKPGAPIDDFCFDVLEHDVADMLRSGTQRLHYVLALRLLPEAQLKRLVHLYALTGSLNVWTAPAGSISSHPPPESMDRPVLRNRAEPSPAERAAAAPISPDGAPDLSDAPRHEKPGTAFRRVSALSRAEALLAQGNLAAAEREAALGLELEPRRAELVALHAWLVAQKPDANLPQLWSRLDFLVQKASSSVRVHFYRGLLLKKMGKHASALQEFREVVELDPHHIDAAREVFLYEKNRAQWLLPVRGAASGTFAKTSPNAGLLKRWLGQK